MAQGIVLLRNDILSHITMSSDKNTFDEECKTLLR